ncbi:MAG: type II secretion system protein [Oscillospiraceae bacterium]
MKKKLKGFTLVELIVVIAIIGVLAAILVPSMMGYVKKSKYATANTNAKEIYNNLTSYATQMYVSKGITGGFPNVTVNKQYLRDTYASMPEEQRKAMSVDLEGYFGVVYDKDGYPAKTAWAKSGNDNEVVGRYPNPSSLEEPANWTNWTNG